MATLAATDATLATAIAALAGMGARLSNDWRTDRDSIPAGDARFQLRLWKFQEDEVQSAAVVRDVLSAEVTVAKRVATDGEDRTYVLGDMKTQLDSLVSLSWWRATGVPGAIIDAEEGRPFVAEGPERELAVFQFTVRVEAMSIVLD